MRARGVPVPNPDGSPNADAWPPRFPAVFSHHMVLQRDKPVPVWGTADPGEKVAVSIAGQTKTATADAQGNWSLRLDAIQAGGPHQLTVRATNKLTIEDVLIGEVWLCSGQSNMAMNVSGTLNAEEEIAEADYPKVRMFTVARNAAEAVKGLLIGVPEASLPEPESGEYYWRDLIGAEVVNTDDQLLGRIRSLIETGANDVLVIEPVEAAGEAAGKETGRKTAEDILIPFHANYVLEVDMAAGRIRVDWPAAETARHAARSTFCAVSRRCSCCWRCLPQSTACVSLFAPPTPGRRRWRNCQTMPVWCCRNWSIAVRGSRCSARAPCARQPPRATSSG